MTDVTSDMTSTPKSRELAPARPTWHILLVRPETMTLLLLVAGLVGASILSPFFLDVSYILRSFTLTAEMSIAALVLTLVIISGEIDLSAAANMALSACIFAWGQDAGVPLLLAILIGLGAGLAMGALNAFMSIRMQLPSIIVTIGTLIFFRGLAQVIAGDRSIRVPESFIGINQIMLFGVPLPVVIFVVLAVALGFLLASTSVGRQIYQIGTNQNAALHAGINAKRIKWGLFLLLGFVSAAAGIMAASRLGSVRYDLVLGGELQMVLMAMLGGTYIFGGRGTILGTFLAAWLLVVVSTGMTVANLLPAIQLTVLGILLIVAIIATNFIYARTQR
ncbi:MAG: ABC transporter permease [Pseudomonadota bacterium]